MKFPYTKTYTLSTGAILTSLLTLIVYTQYIYDSTQKPFSPGVQSASRILLPEKILPYISLGFNNVLADMYWIRSIQDLLSWTGRDPYYINYFKNISALDPKFEYPYLFSILTIPRSETRLKSRESLDAVAHIAQRGIDALPNSWQIPFYLGTQYYIFTKTYEPAESYLAIAASRPGAPDGVYLVYSTFVGRNLVRTKNLLNNPDANTTIRDLVKVIYDNTDNETTKDLVAKGFQVEAVRQMLEKGIIAYKERFQVYPNSVEDMLTYNFIKLPENFLNEFSVRISKRDGSFVIVTK